MDKKKFVKHRVIACLILFVPFILVGLRLEQSDPETILSALRISLGVTSGLLAFAFADTFEKLQEKKKEKRRRID
ncbi:MAG: hypothetical protein FWE10_07270 [Rikenellaceae bacterium]|nr:hypothetical protein [Rikenellaceae bacterium]MCL2693242.1 hypothetical protein [Rikenellaceae bacterium]